MSICGCWRRVGLLACHHPRVALSPLGSFAFSRQSAVGCIVGCGRVLRFLRGSVVVSVAVSSRIRYRMIRCG